MGGGHPWFLLVAKLESLPSCSPWRLSNPLPAPEHAAAFPSPGRTNGLIQGHPARAVSLRQSCAQLCVKNGSKTARSRPASRQDWWVQIAGDLFPSVAPPETAGRQGLALEHQAAQQAGAPFQGWDRLPAGYRPTPTSELSRQSCGGGPGLPSCFWAPLERALDFITRPLGANWQLALCGG